MVESAIAVEDFNDGIVDAVLEAEEEVEVAEADIGVYGDNREAEAGQGEADIRGSGSLADAALARSDDDDAGCLSGELGFAIPLKNRLNGCGAVRFGLEVRFGWFEGFGV